MAIHEMSAPRSSISAMALRIDGDLGIAFEAATHLMKKIGTITHQKHYNAMGTVSHPDGRQVKLNLIVYHAITEPADYLELNRRSGDALLAAEVYRMLICLLTRQYAPRMTGGAMAMIPPPPGLSPLHRESAHSPPSKPCLGPGAAPLDVPHLSLGESKAKEELAWSAGPRCVCLVATRRCP